MGMVRFIVVAETDAIALQAARRGYLKWYDSFNYLFRLHGRSPMHGERAKDFDTVMQKGLGTAGSPETVIAFLAPQIADAGANYLVGQLAFGDLSFEESKRSVELFAREVMPAL